MEKDYVTNKKFNQAVEELQTSIEKNTDAIQKNGVLLESLDGKVDTVIEMLGSMYEKVSTHEEKIEQLQIQVAQNTFDIKELKQNTR